MSLEYTDPIAENANYINFGIDYISCSVKELWKLNEIMFHCKKEMTLFKIVFTTKEATIII